MARYCAHAATIGAQPQLQGELLGELGRMYMRLDEIDAAMPVLAEAIASLESMRPRATRRSIARAPTWRPRWLQTSDDMQRTGALAATARDACTSREVECAKVARLCRQYAESDRVVLGRR